MPTGTTDTARDKKKSVCSHARFWGGKQGEKGGILAPSRGTLLRYEGEDHSRTTHIYRVVSLVPCFVVCAYAFRRGRRRRFVSSGGEGDSPLVGGKRGTDDTDRKREEKIAHLENKLHSKRGETEMRLCIIELWSAIIWMVMGGTAQ